MASLELTLDRPGHYLLGDLGSLQAERRFGALIEGGGESWRLRRKLLGFGQAITAVNASDGKLAASYVPRGFLHMRGIYGGELRLQRRALEWRADHQLGRAFTLSEAGETLATLAALAEPTPVRVEAADPGSLPPLLLLFCCHIAKQAVDTARVGAAVGAGTAAAP
jgi:hypothetical protein